MCVKKKRVTKNVYGKRYEKYLWKMFISTQLFFFLALGNVYANFDDKEMFMKCYEKVYEKVCYGKCFL